MTSDNTILTIAIIAVVVSGIGLYLTYFNIFAFESIMLSTDTGTATVVISSEAIIRFAHDALNWGSGYVTPGERAVLDTEAGTVINFQGTPPPFVLTNGFLIENAGTRQLLVDIYALPSTPPPFLDLSVAPLYQYKISNCWSGSAYTCIDPPNQGLLQPKDTDVACPIADQRTGWSAFVEMPISDTGPGDRICGILAGTSGMKYEPLNDEMEVNIKLDFSDSIRVGSHSSTITIVGTGIS